MDCWSAEARLLEKMRSVGSRIASLKTLVTDCIFFVDWLGLVVHSYSIEQRLVLF